MLFLKISNANVLFSEKILTWKSYIINKAIATNKRVPIINPKEYVIAMLDMGSKTFIRHVAISKQEKMTINAINKA